MTPSLAPATKAKVACLCAVYALASATAAGVASVGAVDDAAGGGLRVGLGGVGAGAAGLGGSETPSRRRPAAARLMLALPAALADAVFVLWIFSIAVQDAGRRRRPPRHGQARPLPQVHQRARRVGLGERGVGGLRGVRPRRRLCRRAVALRLGAARVLGRARLGGDGAVAALFRPSAAASRFAYSEADADEWEQAEKGERRNGNGNGGAPVGSIAISAIVGSKSPLPRSSGGEGVSGEEVGKRE